MEDSINELTRGDKILAFITFAILLIIPLIPFVVFAAEPNCASLDTITCPVDDDDSDSDSGLLQNVVVDSPANALERQHCNNESPDNFWDRELQTCLRAEDGTIIWQGFRHYWESDPHRLSRFGSAFTSPTYDVSKNAPVDGVETANATTEFRIGAYPDDTGHAIIKGKFVKSGSLGFYEGHVDEACLKLAGTVAEADSVTCEQEVDLAAIGFADYDHVTVVLRGFHFRATSDGSGYNTRGFTVRVIPEARHGDRFHFAAVMGVHPEHSPERPLPDDDCWGVKNCPYSYDGYLYYTIIGVNDADGAITEAPSDGTNSYAQHIKMYPGKVPDLADEATRTATIRGERDLRHAFVAIQGIKWHLGAWDATSKDGRYIRDLRFNVSDFAYDSNAGDARFLTNMYFSNASKIPFGYDATFTMWNTLIQTDDPQYAATGQEVTEHIHNADHVKVATDVSYDFAN